MNRREFFRAVAGAAIGGVGASVAKPVSNPWGQANAVLCDVKCELVPEEARRRTKRVSCRMHFTGGLTAQPLVCTHMDMTFDGWQTWQPYNDVEFTRALYGDKA